MVDAESIRETAIMHCTTGLNTERFVHWRMLHAQPFPGPGIVYMIHAIHRGGIQRVEGLSEAIQQVNECSHGVLLASEYIERRVNMLL